MSVSKFIVKDTRDIELFNRFFAMSHPEYNKVAPSKIYVYPSLSFGVEMTVLRFVAVDGMAYSYNIPAGRFNIFKTKIKEGHWGWMLAANGIKELMVSTVRFEKPIPEQYQRFVEVYTMGNVNEAQYTLPEEVFTAEQKVFAELDGLYDGDIHRLEKEFNKVANITSETIKQINANLRLIAMDKGVVKNHDLYFGFYIAKDAYRIAPSLTRIEPHLPEGGELVIEQQPLKAEDWTHLEGVGFGCVDHIIKAGNKLNAALAEFEDMPGRHPIITGMAKDMLHGAMVMLTQAGHMVYRYKYEADKETVDNLTNDILTRLAALPGVIGLDLNSWRVWDYTDIANPVRVDSIDLEGEIYNRYIDSFVEALYNHMVTLNSPLLRPYSTREAVKPENIGDHALGSIRLAK